MRQSRTAVNRFALGCTGLVLLLAGGWLATGGVHPEDRPPAWWPSWWPEPAAGHRVLLDADRLSRLRGEGWWTPSVTAAAITLSLLFACWFLAQFRSGAARQLPLAAPGGTVRAQALAEALAGRASAVPGVARGRARVLPRSRRRLEVRLRVWLRPDTSPQAVLPALCAVAAEAEAAAAPYSAHTRLRISAGSHRVPHVR
ncbi:hypothetical protein [Streptomyces malaysiense]|uniref:Alkaline shock response membrane anchor protein AmaP n=1 Tax=Streptomyces malaysiense TaxID=1428626 RepID=A0A1J4Q093_9ACTN|nr:hypothetical protein [Streptomyces malaysiense]OIK26402.1 hypothetical protein VT52_016475 [Streptomyces malaysiense]